MDVNITDHRRANQIIVLNNTLYLLPQLLESDNAFYVAKDFANQG
jgi:hypothetical protein